MTRGHNMIDVTLTIIIYKSMQATGLLTVVICSPGDLNRFFLHGWGGGGMILLPRAGKPPVNQVI